ncbi:hypothetical protein CYMTET_52271 [Cymbomonas tetramitiformis]|uniref:Uncharacterized protein n=1 Tax=Cymbomonas tetramitiformis TaxID=36881 RepID=A0AAE0BL61_9CHLO|nr:hypothetical protein CYMTET_52271 [Cymbomonas tetramitiformis]
MQSSRWCLGWPPRNSDWRIRWCPAAAGELCFIQRARGGACRRQGTLIDAEPAVVPAVAEEALTGAYNIRRAHYRNRQWTAPAEEAYGLCGKEECFWSLISKPAPAAAHCDSVDKSSEVAKHAFDRGNTGHLLCTDCFVPFSVLFVTHALARRAQEEISFPEMHSWYGSEAGCPVPAAVYPLPRLLLQEMHSWYGSAAGCPVPAAVYPLPRLLLHEMHSWYGSAAGCTVPAAVYPLPRLLLHEMHSWYGSAAGCPVPAAVYPLPRLLLHEMHSWYGSAAGCPVPAAVYPLPRLLLHEMHSWYGSAAGCPAPAFDSASGEHAGSAQVLVRQLGLIGERLCSGARLTPSELCENCVCWVSTTKTFMSAQVKEYVGLGASEGDSLPGPGLELACKHISSRVPSPPVPMDPDVLVVRHDAESSPYIREWQYQEAPGPVVMDLWLAPPGQF